MCISIIAVFAIFKKLDKNSEPKFELIPRQATFSSSNVKISTYNIPMSAFSAISDKLSYHAKNILSFHQKVYSSALLQHCQFTNSRTAPTRFTELLSVFNTIHKTVNNMRFSCMMVQCFVPNFKFKKLMREVYFNDWKEKGNTVALEKLL